jgi:hypothetical protein
MWGDVFPRCGDFVWGDVGTGCHSERPKGVKSPGEPETFRAAQYEIILCVTETGYFWLLYGAIRAVILRARSNPALLPVSLPPGGY